MLDKKPHYRDFYSICLNETLYCLRKGVLFRYAGIGNHISAPTSQRTTLIQGSCIILGEAATREREVVEKTRKILETRKNDIQGIAIPKYGSHSIAWVAGREVKAGCDPSRSFPEGTLILL